MLTIPNLILFVLVLFIAGMIYRGYVMRKTRTDNKYLVPWGMAGIAIFVLLFATVLA